MRMLQRDVVLLCPAWHEAAGWRRDLTAEYRVLQLHQLSCSCVERFFLWNATVVAVLEGWNIQTERTKILLSFGIALQVRWLSCSSVERSHLWNARPVPARVEKREVILCCPARNNAAGWWRDLTAEGIEPNPGPPAALAGWITKGESVVSERGFCSGSMGDSGRCSN